MENNQKLFKVLRETNKLFNIGLTKKTEILEKPKLPIERLWKKLDTKVLLLKKNEKDAAAKDLNTFYEYYSENKEQPIKLTTENWIILSKYLKETVVMLNQTSEFSANINKKSSEKIKKLLKELTKDKSLLIYDFKNNFIPFESEIKNIFTRLMIKNKYNKEFKESIFHWSVGKHLQEAFLVGLNKKDLERILYNDIDNKETIKYLYEVTKIRIPGIKKDFFQHIKNFSKIIKGSERFVIITAFLVLKNSCYNLLSNPVAITYNAYTLSFFNNFTEFLETTKKEPLDHLALLRKLYTTLLNILNVVAKEIGVTIVNKLQEENLVFLQKRYVYKKSLNMKVLENYICFKEEYLIYFVKRELPEIILFEQTTMGSDAKYKTYIGKDKKSCFVVKKERIHKKDFMYVAPVRRSVDIMPRYKLNRDFCIDFFTQLNEVLTKPLNEFSENFLSNICELNLNALDSEPELKKVFLTDLLSVSSLKKCYIDKVFYQKYSKNFLDTFKNKIYQTKILLAEFVFTISILIKFKCFNFTYFFDARFRFYPDTSTFNYVFKAAPLLLLPLIEQYIAYTLSEFYSTNCEYYDEVLHIIEKKIIFPCLVIII